MANIPRWDVNNSVEVVHGLAVEVNDTSESLSSAIDLTLFDRARCKILATFRASTSPTGAIAHGVTFAVKESATAGGAYTACATDGSLAIRTTAGERTVGVLLNPAKPFLKLSATGDDADALFFVTGLVAFIKPTV